jgi:hypothetical protein
VRGARGIVVVRAGGEEVRDGRVEAAGEVLGEAGGDASPRGERHGVWWVGGGARRGGTAGSKTTAGGPTSTTWAFGPRCYGLFPYTDLGFR